MNIITDTIDEIRKMKVRKVWWKTIFKCDNGLVLAPRAEFRDDHMLSTHDMEDTYDSDEHWKPSSGGAQVISFPHIFMISDW